MVTVTQSTCTQTTHTRYRQLQDETELEQRSNIRTYGHTAEHIDGRADGRTETNPSLKLIYFLELLIIM